jgi:DNA repair protein REV1
LECKSSDQLDLRDSTSLTEQEERIGHDGTADDNQISRSPSPSNREHRLNEPPSAKHAKMTAEEHNAMLLKDPRVWKTTVVNPDFLKQYYQESRLHHLSTWKADLKSQLQALTAEKSSSEISIETRSWRKKIYPSC